METADCPDRRRIPMAPAPGGVDMAAMVSVCVVMGGSFPHLTEAARVPAKSPGPAKFVDNFVLTDIMETKREGLRSHRAV